MLAQPRQRQLHPGLGEDPIGPRVGGDDDPVRSHAALSTPTGACRMALSIL